MWTHWDYCKKLRKLRKFSWSSPLDAFFYVTRHNCKNHMLPQLWKIIRCLPTCSLFLTPNWDKFALKRIIGQCLLLCELLFRLIDLAIVAKLYKFLYLLSSRAVFLVLCRPENHRWMEAMSYSSKGLLSKKTA